MFVAYLRVSTADQNLDRQRAMIQEWQKQKNISVEDVIYFEEKVSGKNINDRKELLKVMDFLRDRDTLVVTSLDRLEQILKF